MPTDLTPQQQQAQADFAAATGLPFGAPPRVEQCPACKGEGVRCQEECHGTGRVVSGGVLPSLLAIATQLRGIAAAEMEMAPKDRMLVPELIDELVVLAESADRWSGVHARTQHDGDAAVQLSKELVATLEQERQRYEEQGARLRKAEAALVLERRMRMQDEQSRRELVDGHVAELAALHDHAQQLSTENEELRSEVGALQLDLQAANVAVQDATQAVLDAGAQLSIARAEADVCRGECIHPEFGPNAACPVHGRARSAS